MWIANCMDTVGDANISSGRSFVLGWPTVNFVATFSSSEQKEKWRSYLQRYIMLAKEKEQPKSILLKIFTENIKNCACSVTITVTNSDTANDTINMLLTMLGITGSEKDFQLWVSSGKEKLPLTGHEHPYGIKMSHLPSTKLLPKEAEDSVSPSPTQESLLLEQKITDMQIHFILKPRHPAQNKQGRDSGQKTMKSTVFRDWAFWWRAGTCQKNHCRVAPSAKPRQLFGVSLTGICDKDNLPFPILDMLSVINRKGPLLEGIFRKPACINSCRNLKEKLNSGDRVNCYSKSVHVVACVLKDFLENIEGSLLSSKLYEKWLGVLNEVTEKEKINAAQRLLTQLPKANVVLLRYLFGVLYNIEQQSSSNQMTAYDLSVCIAPSILCPLNSCSLELEDNFIKKASLVQFLIENCLKIFGEDITSLLGENSKSCHNNEKAADSDQNTKESSAFTNSSFGHCAGTWQNNQCTAAPSEKSGQLFGVSLTDIFHKDNFPFPILDFLENIEGSLLSSELYEKWLGVLDEVTEEEKINAAQRLLAQLPNVNVVVLRYLPFGVLYSIEQESSPNQITPYDLSVCIAPSILCPPNSGSLELEENFVKKASLIQFLYENCLGIFGEDITSLLGENSKSCHNNEKAADSVQNTKESSAFTNSSFGHCAGTWQNNQCTAAPSEKSGQLFGVSLTDIFHKDNFPFPILDFLENIEGSLLSSELYEKWLDVIDEVTEEEKINAAQRLLAQLPNVNVVVLRYLFGVLYSIEQESSPNQITPYDLSVCIAPSILCPPNSGSLELEENFVKKASLIQFLYENCLGIFGEDITSLLGENSKSCHNNEKAADSGQKTTKRSLFRRLAFWCCGGICWNKCTAEPSAEPRERFGVPSRGYL
ncbi:rho GTPase-activating protein 20-like [Canis lupus familiaris]|uniref:rho GTPase-activating protein 20-like n=1 Tax=Canis lupus familiaris TaxID=9615 RepID=UPI0018F7D5CD|nr:rho GTPase-activating protein 20-like [Canis lupus familiaris]